MTLTVRVARVTASMRTAIVLRQLSHVDQMRHIANLSDRLVPPDFYVRDEPRGIGLHGQAGRASGEVRWYVAPPLLSVPRSSCP